VKKGDEFLHLSFADRTFSLHNLRSCAAGAEHFERVALAQIGVLPLFRREFGLAFVELLQLGDLALILFLSRIMAGSLRDSNP